MHSSISSRRKPVDRLKCFVETSLFSVSAVKRNGLYRIVGFEQPFCRTFDPLSDDVGMYGELDQFMESELEFLAVDGELPAEVLDAVFHIKMLIDVVSDLTDQLGVPSFHFKDRFNGMCNNMEIACSGLAAERQAGDYQNILTLKR
jgi:hypothetical protein